MIYDLYVPVCEFPLVKGTAKGLHACLGSSSHEIQ